MHAATNIHEFHDLLLAQLSDGLGNHLHVFAQPLAQILPVGRHGQRAQVGPVGAEHHVPCIDLGQEVRLELREGVHIFLAGGHDGHRLERQVVADVSALSADSSQHNCLL